MRLLVTSQDLGDKALEDTYAKAVDFSLRVGHWNHRKAKDGERTVAALRLTEGVRLTYKEPVSRRSASGRTPK